MISTILLVSYVLFGSIITLRAEIPAAYVDIGYGARSIGMGGAFVAIPCDVHALFWNPAALSTLKHNQVTAMYTKQFGLIPYFLAAYGTRFNNRVKVSWCPS